MKAKVKWEDLTPDQILVLRCIVFGQKRDLTCIALDMSRQSYSKHRRSLMVKLECQTDVDLTWFAIRHGWVCLSVNETYPVWVGGNSIPTTN